MKKQHFVFFVLIALFLGACNFNSSRMYRTPKGYSFADKPSSPDLEYRLRANDIVDFRLYTNDGFKLIDLYSISDNRPAMVTGDFFRYRVEFDGFVKLPIIGRVELKGKTLREAEVFLQDMYAKYYISPFVILTVSNKRIIVFPGNGGAAKVVDLPNDNISLVEGLAMAGGITENGKAKQVKLVRGEGSKQQVFIFNLNTVEGVEAANIVLLPNDVIYVEPRSNTTRLAIREVGPIISILVSAVTLIVLLQRVN